MAVSSCRMRKEVIWERGAVASAEVYLCRNLGRRWLKRDMRDADVGGGVGWVAKRRGRMLWMFGVRRCVARKRVRCSMLARAGDGSVRVCGPSEGRAID